MPKIVFDSIIVKQNDVDVIELTAKEGNKKVSTFFNPPLSKEELVFYLALTLNSLMSALEQKKEEEENYKRYGQFI